MILIRHSIMELPRQWSWLANFPRPVESSTILEYLVEKSFKAGRAVGGGRPMYTYLHLKVEKDN